MGKRVLITGDRNWTDAPTIRHWLLELKSVGYDTLIEGEALGADTIAREEAEKLGFTIAESLPGVKGFPANWELHHRAAGPIRNTQMLKEGKPDLFVAFHPHILQSKGTRNMIHQCGVAGIPGYLVSDKERSVTL